MSRANPWARKINYDESIAEDERCIAMYDSETARAISASLTSDEINWISQGYLWHGPRFALHNVERAGRIFRLTPEDLAYLAARMDEQVPGLPAIPPHGWYARGDEIQKRLEYVVVMPEEKRAAAVKRAKTDLARHRRNKVKFGNLG